MSKTVKEWLIALVQALIVVSILYIVFWPVKIDGSSMENTFSDGDRVFISKVFTITKNLKDKDVIVCKSDNYSEDKKLIKRIVGMPGDHLKISGGKVYVNDEEVDEPYAVGATFGEVDIVIPDGYVYVLGDNREHTLDSRIIGLIEYEKVIGRVIFKIYPFNDIGLF